MTSNPLAWLIECWTNGKRCTFATIDENDNSWWPIDQWKGVTRAPLGVIGQRELLHGVLPPGVRDTDETPAPLKVGDAIELTVSYPGDWFKTTRTGWQIHTLPKPPVWIIKHPNGTVIAVAEDEFRRAEETTGNQT